MRAAIFQLQWDRKNCWIVFVFRKYIHREKFERAFFPLLLWNKKEAASESVATTTKAVNGWHCGIQAMVSLSMSNWTLWRIYHKFCVYQLQFSRNLQGFSQQKYNTRMRSKSEGWGAAFRLSPLIEFVLLFTDQLRNSCSFFLFRLTHFYIRFPKSGVKCPWCETSVGWNGHEVMFFWGEMSLGSFHQCGLRSTFWLNFL